MGLFSKSAPDVDERFLALIFPRNDRARAHFAPAHEAVQGVLTDGEEIRAIGVDLDRWGNPVTVVTSRRVLTFKRAQVRSEASGPVTDLKLVPQVNTGQLSVLGKPDLDVHFSSFTDANAFMTALDPRDIAKLYPAFFREILHAANLPETPTNMRRLIERVARMIMAGGAYSYFEQGQDIDARERFDKRFKGDLPPEAIESACDDMIDWLWAWRATCHAALRKLIPEIGRLLISEDSFLMQARDEIPPMGW